MIEIFLFVVCAISAVYLAIGAFALVSFAGAAIYAAGDTVVQWFKGLIP